MKKIYSLVVMMIAGLLAMNVSAKTIKLQTTLEGSVWASATYGYNNPNLGAIPVETPLEYEWEDETDGNINVMPNQGFQIVDVTINDVSQNTGKVKQYSIKNEDVEDGALVLIKTEVAAQMIFTIVADADAIYFTNNYRTFDKSNQVDGKWEYTPADRSHTYIYAKDGYIIKSITTTNGTTLSVPDPTVYDLYSGHYSTSETFVIETAKADDTRSKSASIVVNGDASVVTVYRNGHVQISSDEFDSFKFDPDVDLPLRIYHKNYYNTELYNVSVNGTPATNKHDNNIYYNSWQIEQLEDGDVITVDVDYPDIQVPVTVTFTDESTKGVVRTFNVNNQPVATEVWSAEGYTVKLGSQINMAFDDQSYDIKSIKINDEIWNKNYYNAKVKSEDGLKVEIDAAAYEPYHVKIISRAYDKLTLVKSPGDEVSLTEVESTFDFPRSQSQIQLKAIDGYYIDEILNGENKISGTTIYLSNMTAVEGVIELEVFVEEFKRDKQLVVFVAGEESDWRYANIASSYDLSYDLRQTVQTPAGYSFVNFCDQDLPMQPSYTPMDYTQEVIYILDGEKVEKENYSPYKINAKDGSVLKVFYGEEAEKHTVILNIDPNAKALVHTDYITPAEDGDISVHHGTHVVISSPVATLAEGAAEVPFKVEVDGEKMEADAQGRVIIPVTKDTQIDVKEGETAIGSIDSEDNSVVTVYNLQGVCVLNNAPAAKVSQLPAGLYIVNGNKVVVK